MNKMTEFEIIYHGVDFESYFTGCGISFSRFHNVVTGIGDSELEAINDAISQINDVDVDINPELSKIVSGSPCRNCIPANAPDDCHVYVSVKYNTTSDFTI